MNRIPRDLWNQFVEWRNETAKLPEKGITSSSAPDLLDRIVELFFLLTEQEEWHPIEVNKGVKEREDLIYKRESFTTQKIGEKPKFEAVGLPVLMERAMTQLDPVNLTGITIPIPEGYRILFTQIRKSLAAVQQDFASMTMRTINEMAGTGRKKVGKARRFGHKPISDVETNDPNPVLDMTSVYRSQDQILSALAKARSEVAEGRRKLVDRTELLSVLEVKEANELMLKKIEGECHRLIEASYREHIRNLKAEIKNLEARKAYAKRSRSGGK